MRFYVASGLENQAKVKEAAAALRALGHEQSYDWTTHGDVRRFGGERMGEVAQNEIGAVVSSDLVLVLLPGARGTHTELGAALASCHTGKQVWIWSEDGSHFEFDARSCAFYFHPCVRRFTGDFSKVIAAAREAFGGNEQ